MSTSAATTTTYLLTGASRGLGLNYTKELLKSSPSVRVVAAVRDPSNASQLEPVKKEFGDRLFVVKCDVTSSESTKEAARALEDSGFLKSSGGLDVVIANAGVAGGGFKSSTQFSEEELQLSVSTNLFGVVNTVNAFLPLLRKGEKKQIFVTSSLVGSLSSEWARKPFASAYSASKAAVNMYAIKLSAELGEEGFTVIPFHPGYVKTDMNAETDTTGALEPSEAAELALKNVFAKATKEHNGKFLSHDGTELPW
ncbi:hypothetical protein JCM5350_003427 [Sporobolomyces pararoseus]